MTCGIYKITNTKNDKVYIGQSINLKQRMYRHNYLLKNNKHNNKHLQNAYNLNPSIFSFEVITQSCEGLLDNLECYYILKYKSTNIDYGYNKDFGGNLNKVVSEETKNKMSESHKGRIPTEETRIKLSLSSKGHKRTVGIKHSKKANTEKSIRQKGKIGTGKGAKGYKLTEEHKQKISKSLKGRKFSEEHCVKISLNQKNRYNKQGNKC